MKPQYIRVIKSLNQDFQSNIPSQATIHLRTVRPILNQQNTIASAQFLQGFTGVTAATPSRVIVNPLPSTFTLTNETTAVKTNSSIVAVPIHETSVKSSSSVVCAPVKGPSNNDIMPINDTFIQNNKTGKSKIISPINATSNLHMMSSPSKKKRISSPHSEVAQRNQKQSSKRMKVEESVKRKSWTENETITFISVWTDYYPQLISGKSRHSPIYHSMANQLNQMLKDRSLTAADVKSKIGNMVTEYRRKKKELGTTGSSPSSWPYYDLIDKLLGERPYNNESLLSDSIVTEEEQEEFLDDINNASLPDLNATQISEQVDDSATLTINNDEPNNLVHGNATNSTNASNIVSISKPDVPATISSTTKKTVNARKKTKSETKRIRLKSDIIKTRIECQRVIQNYRRNLNRKNQLILSTLLLFHSTPFITNRSIWCFKKSGRWWSEIVPLMSNQQFKENFRIERSTFSSLLQQIRPHIEKLDTNYRAAIPIEKRLACALYALGSSSEFRTIDHLFGIGKSTAREIFHEFCSVLVNKFFHRFIKFPTTDAEIKETIDGFLIKCGYPLCLGAVDGTHIAIKPPLGFECDYFNYKKYHSIIMLATVNSNLLFTYINIGAPGRCNDSSIYNNCSLSNVIQHPIYQNHFMMINNIMVHSHLIADSAFALSSNLMKPYSDRPNMPKTQTLFNYRLSRARCSIERAFDSLKNRFRLLHRKLEHDLNNVINIVKAATIIHNLCIYHGDNIEVDWETLPVIHKKLSSNVHTNRGIDTREALTEFFVQNPL
ncbi:unnamed protein product [Rotaria sordida]|uniref:DDE Tnp4 domain-containing protein n=1 Tax=Rotaria sordida TaxID=392033 RepID=A0A819XII5_9BILA|nr:unnamed protein product [Rotaria sordida]CAF4140105.1 unnamed protein product [Rotaria sordida]